MKRLKFVGFSIFVLCLLYLGGSCNGEDEDVGAPMEKTEQEALYSAIQDFVGKWWNGSDLYPDPCGWTPIQGVSCDLFDGFWYVTDLSIGPVHDNSLNCAPNVEFSPHLFALRHLKSLSFFNCFVSPRQHPVSIPAHGWESLAETLESLEFRSNDGLTGIIPKIFGELTNLQSLVLVENGLSGELPQSIGNLFNLRRLNLAGNSFTGQIPYTFGGLNRLLILDISRNSLSGLLPLTFGGLTSLLKLDLSNNQLNGKIPLEIGNLKNLTLLALSNNNLSGGLTQTLDDLSSLQELVLSNNPIGGDIMGLDWKKLKGLVALDLGNTSLTRGIPESIAELNGLRFLGLNDNRLTGDIPPNLASLPNVGAIYINGNNLTGQLKFPGLFYGKMRRRFGAWDNPNLCYPTGLIKSDYVPFGVKQCPEGIMKYETRLDAKANWGENGNWNSSRASLGFSECGVSGLLVFVIEVIMVLIFNLYV
ncbi:piriformospora indica-insensitive protein 2 [Phtheirospermum japonicum]|uniref:Piriformospora indica-insensitive protein 2 n=1 Tax=Phtheirospermum japonicum TaxID=374723 RepID=A0A830C1T5_9LAMI|nr:piriformospora indica-insensitive protein 2 [Phtheirospermum japonicum]